MNIIVTGRHITVADGIREYAEKKINKLEIYFTQTVNVRVILSLEKIDRTAEIIINGDGAQFYGKESGETFFAAIDMLVAKIDGQIVRYKNKNQPRKWPRDGMFSSLFVFGNEPDEPEREIKVTETDNKPKDKIEAYLQMKNDKADFTLFKQEINADYSGERYAVLYKNGAKFRMTEVLSEMNKNSGSNDFSLLEYELDVKDESPVHPVIDFKETKNQVRQMTLIQAIDEFDAGAEEYLPFFNMESEYLNIVYKDGKDIAVMMPALT
ncbi:MAG: ribosome-associated translation inhibitor RaiA [Leptospirales bacterium]|nr:ribosome-associated translation inhibitor RaiA [Leptospirales bacterium]